MARKVFISFLGTSKYIDTNYYIPSQPNQRVEKVKYIQEALIRLYCKDWKYHDKAYIFLTDEAKKQNWDNPEVEGGALKNRLDNLSKEGYPIGIEVIKDVPTALESHQIWELFELVYSKLKEGDEVILDITHGFRSLPMLGIILINYAKVIKKVKITDVHYGAFEKLGPAFKVKELPVEERNAPIVSLKSFINLMDWTAGVDNFLDLGNTRKLEKLIQSEAQDFREIGHLEEEKQLNELASGLKKFSGMLSTCRGKELLDSFDMKSFKENISKNSEQELIAQLQPLFTKIENKLSTFRNKQISNGLAAVEWCIDHDMLQQGITFLEETIKTYVIEISLGEAYRNEYFYRNVANMALYESTVLSYPQNKNTHVRKDFYDVPADVDAEEVLEKMLAFTNKNINISRAYCKLIGGEGLRNDVNHCGFSKNAKSAEKIKSELKKIYQEVLEAL